MRKKIIINQKETNYSVTDDARIFNDITGREIKGTYATNEYHSVQLVIDGKPKTFMFHRLVAEAFCENPNHYTIVDHIDKNKHNDNASNLRWVTSKQNANNRPKIIKRTKNEKYDGDFSKEEWKPVFGQPNFMINKKGKVINLNTRNILIPQNRNGYLRVNLNNSRYSLHILVWETFNNQKIPQGMQIDHIDGDKANNDLQNLRLVNSSDNVKNVYINGHSGQVAVKQYSLDGTYLQTFNSIRAAAQAVNTLEAGLKDATNRHGTCAGYYWIRANDSITINEVLYSWIPTGYKLLEEYPTYCINKEGQIYNKRNKANCTIKYRTDNKPFIIIKGRRVDILPLVEKYFNCPTNSLIAGKP